MPKTTGKHSQLTGFLIAYLNFEIRRLQLPYLIPKESVDQPGIRCILERSDSHTSLKSHSKSLFQSQISNQ